MRFKYVLNSKCRSIKLIIKNNRLNNRWFNSMQFTITRVFCVKE